jgi:hypothetical protein
MAFIRAFGYLGIIALSFIMAAIIYQSGYPIPMNIAATTIGGILAFLGAVSVHEWGRK